MDGHLTPEYIDDAGMYGDYHNPYGWVWDYV